MAAPKTRGKKLSQEIDLQKEFGIDFSGKRALKELIGQKIIDRIVERTESGMGIAFDKRGAGRLKPLKKPYSKQYADSLEFKAFDKHKNQINLTLTGDMLSAIDITKQTGNSITIGFDDRDEELKAHGNQTGKNGKAPKMKRPFFGVNKIELNEIKKDLRSDIKEALKVQQDLGKQAFEAFILSKIDEVDDG